VAYGKLWDQIGMSMAIEMALFVLLLLVAFAYAWRKRAFEWQ
jgi:NADH:ubiquinone oxidoreductase subunit 3 (subunit A)